MKLPRLFLVLALALAGCGRHASDSAPLRILCGSSMATPAQEMVATFKARQGIDVTIDLGGSETLLPRVVAGAEADLFICHDPFEQKVKEANRWAGVARVGQLRPVLLVHPGNPRSIRSTHDLTNQNLKIGIGDPRYSTCGEMFVQLLKTQGILEGVMKQVTLQARTHTELANGLILGPLDAVVVWNFIAPMYAGKVQLVPTADAYPPVIVTVVGLAQSPRPKARDAFLEWCRSAEVQAVFAQHGYGPVPP